jgi:8-oxo-dGTP pyrophosphatase MutT (NUDIX family)
MNLNAEQIKKALEVKLPGSVSHQKMIPPGRMLKVPHLKSEKIKHSSVLLVLYPDENELFACLIKRPVHMKHHAGQIAIPGGRIEKNESALETALRETNEEIGLQPKLIKIIGQLSELYVEVSRFLIHPFVGWLDKKPDFLINRNEVEKMVLFPLSKYKNDFGKVELETISGKLTVPCIHFENEIIWGATAMILSEFYDIMENKFNSGE